MLLETTALGRAAARIMEQTTFAEHYRICAKGDGSPRELSRTGSAITYKAKDIRSGEPVALKLIPIASVDPAARERFEEQARAAQLLDHINIAKVCAFGVEDHHFVFVSEYLEGERADSWITAHGPMALDAVLRIALQVVSALSAASFHGLTHRAIWPSNFMIVPGPTSRAVAAWDGRFSVRDLFSRRHDVLSADWRRPFSRPYSSATVQPFSKESAESARTDVTRQSR
jgi:serine/threonine protein kinase